MLTGSTKALGWDRPSIRSDDIFDSLQVLTRAVLAPYVSRRLDAPEPLPRPVNAKPAIRAADMPGALTIPEEFRRK